MMMLGACVRGVEDFLWMSVGVLEYVGLRES